ncbi:MAG TPA: PLD nuclease N-terminal domain-containing protein [Campylobacterales bacterium]|nr:PLD nuclease N-terminal domain-containing protein [Campylobacterales bacterium]
MTEDMATAEGVYFMMGSALLLTFLGVALCIVWIWAIVDVIKSDFKDATVKFVWIAVLIFIPFVGAIIYPFVGKSTKKPLNEPS